ncbi:hypothetical protein NC651_005245 [Populus alba x Populus x berolinensis]|nr:hypothetical protein NC651_005245 [Populus alba x Populus x berolinensis]
MFNELWVAGGPAANALKPKFGLFASREQSHAGIQVPEIELASRISRWNIMGMMLGDAGPFSLCHTTHHMTNHGYENMETLLGRTHASCVFSCTHCKQDCFALFEWVSILALWKIFIYWTTDEWDLRYMYAKIKHLSTAVIFLEGICGILFIFGSSLGAYLLIIHQLIAFPILYDF